MLSRRDEDRILHGLYYYRESIDDEFAVTSDQILWLAAHSYVEGNNWFKDGQLQGVDCSVFPGELRGRLLASKFELPLRYLQHRRLIKLTPAEDGSVGIAVTFSGADRAMRLHTPLGRMDAWYQEHKHGFLGILTTIGVALITALITTLFLERTYQRAAEQPRIIYEIQPQAQPTSP